MKTDFTINVEESFVQRLKDYAASRQENASALIEKFVGFFLPPVENKKQPEPDKEDELPHNLHPDALRLYGAFKTDGKDYDYKKVVEEELIKKYGS